jgi:hypothetical protein
MFAFMCGKIEELSSCLDKISRRRQIFLYDLLWILALGVAAWLMTQKNNCILPIVSHVDWSKIGTACILWVKYKLFLIACGSALSAASPSA